MDRQTKQYLRQSAEDNKLLLKNQRKLSTNFIRQLPNSGYLSSINEKLLKYSKEDNDLLLQNQNIGVVSNPSEIPLNVTEADQQLLKSYVDNIPENYEYQAEDGSIKYRKYKDAGDVPDLEPMDEGVTRAYEEDLQSLDILEKARNKQLSDLKNEYNSVVNEIQQNKSKEVHYKRQYEKGKITDNQYEKALFSFEDQQSNLQNKEERLTDEINKVSKEFDIKTKEFDDAKKYVADIKSRNLEKADSYRDYFNAVNKGAMSTSKEPNETEKEYLDRMKQFATADVPENELANARQLVSKLFRERMKDLIKPDVVIEQVANMLDPVSSESVPNKQRILNNWSFIKSKFLNNYGFNPPNMKADEIVEFFNFVTNADENVIQSYPIEEKLGLNVIGQVQPNNDIKYSLDVANSQGIIMNSKTSQPLVSIQYYIENERRFVVYQIIGGRLGYYKWVDKGKTGRISSYEHLCDVLGIPDTQLRKLIGKSKPDIYKKLRQANIEAIEDPTRENRFNSPVYPMPMVFNETPTILEAQLLGKRKEVFPQRSEEEDVFQDTEGNGLGVMANDFPKFVRFGSVLLELKKLHHHNQLVIKDHRKAAIYGFPSIKVSDTFANIIINMVQKNEPSFSDLSRLNSHEKEIYDVMIALAGLKKRIYNTHDNTISLLKNRLNLLEGEIEIGNNNPKIYNEIRKILFKLHHLKVISMKQVQSHLKQIG